MGSVTFNDSYYVTNVGQSEQNVRISYSESYSAATNKTTVTFTKCEIAADRMLTNCSVRGQVQFNGTTVQDYPLDSTSYQIYIGSGGVNDYVAVPGNGGGNVAITHGSDGKASLTIKLLAVETILDDNKKHFGAAVGSHVYGIADGNSKTVSLTTHTSTLTVNPNGGTWGGGTSSQSFSQAPTSTKTIANPTRTGYTFGGWTLSGGGSISNGTYTYGASNGTLTAKWTINTWTVSYNANGGTGAPASQTKTYGQTLTLSTTKPTKAKSVLTGYTVTYRINYTGGTDPAAATAARTTTYTFSKWNTESDGTGTNYSSGGSYTANAAATLYAQYTSSTTTASVTLPTPTRTGYTLKGWSTSSSATTGSTGSYTPTGNVTLYAVWQLNSHTVTLTKNDYIASVSGGGSKNYGASVTVTAVLGSASGYIYSFTGWYNGSTKVSSNTSHTFTMPDSDVSYQAVGSRTLKTYTVSYDANGGSGAPSAQTKTHGVTLKLSSTVPTRTGYSFLGWSTNSEATSASYAAGGKYTANSAATLYAVWKALSYKISANISSRGVTANILRTSSPIGGAATGLLMDGDTIYYNDVIKVSWAVGSGYQIDTFKINGTDVSSLTEKSVTVKGTLTISLLTKLGAMVYIGNDMYQAFINDGTEWSQYQAYIGNGSSWEAY